MKMAKLLCVTAMCLLGVNGSIVSERFEALERQLQGLQAENVAIRAEMKEASAGELKLFKAEECPKGWTEFNRTQGYLLTGRPSGGTAYTQLNRPMADGELGRAHQHSHEVEIDDRGHTHAATINDPGHGHLSPLINQDGNDVTQGAVPIGFYAKKDANLKTSDNKTGITATMATATSNVDVQFKDNEGESYPLVYVLVCERLA